LEIQVDQRTYCLGDRYPSCPRFAGQEAPPAPAAARPVRTGGKKGGLAVFWQNLATRDRILYLSLIGLLVAILATYGIIIGVVLPARNRTATPTPAPTAQPVPPTTAAAVVPTAEPTTVEPTTAPTGAPTAVPTAVPTGVSTAVPTARPTEAPSTAPATERPPVTNTPVPPTAIPQPTAQPTAQPTTVPTVVIVPTVEPLPTPESIWSLLYFLGPNKAYYVPVERESRPYTDGVARRALELMIQGPLSGTLLRSMPAGMGLNNVEREGATLYVDLDHTFESLGAGQKEAMAVVLAMTEFYGVEQVQFLVNEAPYGLPGSGNTNPVSRPAYVNFEDPYGVDPANATDLVLYFATPDGAYLFPMVRRIPFTLGVAQAAIEEMVKGPGSGYAAISFMPADTGIQSISRDGDTIVVDFNSAFLNAGNRELTVRALILAMTDLRADMDLGVDSVRISVDGVDLGAYWGSAYSGNLYRPWVNPESP
jgi:spore germination protein GerM